jgi:nucleoside-diphosphate-sugar epimerase
MPPVDKFISPGIALIAGWLCESAYRLFNISEEPPLTVFLAKQLSTSHWYNISAAKQDFGYEVEVSLDEGIEKLREWIAGTGSMYPATRDHEVG